MPHHVVESRTHGVTRKGGEHWHDVSESRHNIVSGSVSDSRHSVRSTDNNNNNPNVVHEIQAWIADHCRSNAISPRDFALNLRRSIHDEKKFVKDDKHVPYYSILDFDTFLVSVAAHLSSGITGCTELKCSIMHAYLSVESGIGKQSSLIMSYTLRPCAQNRQCEQRLFNVCISSAAIKNLNLIVYVASGQEKCLQSLKDIIGASAVHGAQEFDKLLRFKDGHFFSITCSGSVAKAMDTYCKDIKKEQTSVSKLESGEQRDIIDEMESVYQRYVLAERGGSQEDLNTVLELLMDAFDRSCFSVTIASLLLNFIDHNGHLGGAADTITDGVLMLGLCKHDDGGDGYGEKRRKKGDKIRRSEHRTQRQETKRMKKSGARQGAEADVDEDDGGDKGFVGTEDTVRQLFQKWIEKHVYLCERQYNQLKDAGLSGEVDTFCKDNIRSFLLQTFESVGELDANGKRVSAGVNDIKNEVKRRCNKFYATPRIKNVIGSPWKSMAMVEGIQSNAFDTALVLDGCFRGYTREDSYYGESGYAASRVEPVYSVEYNAVAMKTVLSNLRKRQLTVPKLEATCFSFGPVRSDPPPPVLFHDLCLAGNTVEFYKKSFEEMIKRLEKNLNCKSQFAEKVTSKFKGADGKYNYALIPQSYSDIINVRSDIIKFLFEMDTCTYDKRPLKLDESIETASGGINTLGSFVVKYQSNRGELSYEFDVTSRVKSEYKAQLRNVYSMWAEHIVQNGGYGKYNVVSYAKKQLQHAVAQYKVLFGDPDFKREISDLFKALIIKLESSTQDVKGSSVLIFGAIIHKLCVINCSTKEHEENMLMYKMIYILSQKASFVTERQLVAGPVVSNVDVSGMSSDEFRLYVEQRVMPPMEMMSAADEAIKAEYNAMKEPWILSLWSEQLLPGDRVREIGLARDAIEAFLLKHDLKLVPDAWNIPTPAHIVCLPENHPAHNVFSRYATGTKRSYQVKFWKRCVASGEGPFSDIRDRLLDEIYSDMYGFGVTMDLVFNQSFECQSYLTDFLRLWSHLRTRRGLDKVLERLLDTIKVNLGMQSSGTGIVQSWDIVSTVIADLTAVNQDLEEIVNPGLIAMGDDIHFFTSRQEISEKDWKEKLDSIFPIDSIFTDKTRRDAFRKIREQANAVESVEQRVVQWRACGDALYDLYISEKPLGVGKYASALADALSEFASVNNIRRWDFKKETESIYLEVLSVKGVTFQAHVWNVMINITREYMNFWKSYVVFSIVKSHDFFQNLIETALPFVQKLYFKYMNTVWTMLVRNSALKDLLDLMGAEGLNQWKLLCEETVYKCLEYMETRDNNFVAQNQSKVLSFLDQKLSAAKKTAGREGSVKWSSLVRFEPPAVRRGLTPKDVLELVNVNRKSERYEGSTDESEDNGNPGNSYYQNGAVVPTRPRGDSVVSPATGSNENLETSIRNYGNSAYNTDLKQMVDICRKERANLSETRSYPDKKKKGLENELVQYEEKKNKAAKTSDGVTDKIHYYKQCLYDIGKDWEAFKQTSDKSSNPPVSWSSVGTRLARVTYEKELSEIQKNIEDQNLLVTVTKSRLDSELTKFKQDLIKSQNDLKEKQSVVDEFKEQVLSLFRRFFYNFSSADFDVKYNGTTRKYDTNGKGDTLNMLFNEYKKNAMSYYTERVNLYNENFYNKQFRYTTDSALYESALGEFKRALRNASISNREGQLKQFSDLQYNLDMAFKKYSLDHSVDDALKALSDQKKNLKEVESRRDGLMNQQKEVEKTLTATGHKITELRTKETEIETRLQGAFKDNDIRLCVERELVNTIDTLDKKLLQLKQTLDETTQSVQGLQREIEIIDLIETVSVKAKYYQTLVQSLPQMPIIKQFTRLREDLLKIDKKENKFNIILDILAKCSTLIMNQCICNTEDEYAKEKYISHCSEIVPEMRKFVLGVFAGLLVERHPNVPQVFNQLCVNIRLQALELFKSSVAQFRTERGVQQAVNVYEQTILAGVSVQSVLSNVYESLITEGVSRPVGKNILKQAMSAANLVAFALDDVSKESSVAYETYDEAQGDSHDSQDQEAVDDWDSSDATGSGDAAGPHASGATVVQEHTTRNVQTVPEALVSVAAAQEHEVQRLRKDIEEKQAEVKSREAMIKKNETEISAIKRKYRDKINKIDKSNNISKKDREWYDPYIELGKFNKTLVDKNQELQVEISQLESAVQQLEQTASATRTQAENMEPGITSHEPVVTDVEAASTLQNIDAIVNLVAGNSFHETNANIDNDSEESPYHETNNDNDVDPEAYYNYFGNSTAVTDEDRKALEKAKKKRMRTEHIQILNPAWILASSQSLCKIVESPPTRLFRLYPSTDKWQLKTSIPEEFRGSPQDTIYFVKTQIRSWTNATDRTEPLDANTPVEGFRVWDRTPSINSLWDQGKSGLMDLFTSELARSDRLPFTDVRAKNGMYVMFAPKEDKGRFMYADSLSMLQARSPSVARLVSAYHDNICQIYGVDKEAAMPITQMMLIHYEPGHGISTHVDNLAHWGCGPIMSVSVGPKEMAYDLLPCMDPSKKPLRVFFKEGQLVGLTGAQRLSAHAIANGLYDQCKWSILFRFDRLPGDHVVGYHEVLKTEIYEPPINTSGVVLLRQPCCTGRPAVYSEGECQARMQHTAETLQKSRALTEPYMAMLQTECALRGGFDLEI